MPLPEALVPGGPFDTRVQQAALVRLANDVGRYPHLERLLRREPPLGARMQRETLEEMTARGRGRGQLPLRAGPARVGQDVDGRAADQAYLLARGKRVGVSSTSHKAIHNLLREVEEVAAEAGVEFRGLKEVVGRG